MRVLVLGGDGYIGWPVAQHLATRGHDICIVDNGIRRRRVALFGGSSLVPIQELGTRVQLAQRHGLAIDFLEGDVELPDVLNDAILRFGPDAVVHLAQQPSAPLSMLSVEQAIATQTSNITSTLRLLFALRDLGPECRLIKLGTMGQYGTPEELPLGEGSLVVTVEDRKVEIPMPKSPGSFYHASKVHDSVNIEMACRLWGLSATELNQGIVYGHDLGVAGVAGETATRLDYDAVHGTVMNRFSVQAAIGMPITVYGAGGQTRGIIALKDALECIRLTVENPPSTGEFRVFNQMTQHLSIEDIASIVLQASRNFDLAPSVSRIRNPRVEREAHPYEPRYSRLQELGLKPSMFDEAVASETIELALRWKARINLRALHPRHSWTKGDTTSEQPNSFRPGGLNLAPRV